MKTLRFLAFTFAALLLLTAITGPATAREAISEPATPKQQASCERSSKEAAPFRERAIRVEKDLVGLGGCVTDSSGIAAVVVSWSSLDGDRHGRICTDPDIIDSLWRCEWDTRRLALGEYTLKLVAVDMAGNRGVTEQRYEIVEAVPREDTPPVPEDPPAAPEAPEEPTESETLNPVQDRFMQEIAICDQGGRIERAPTDSVETISQLEQAELVAACLAPQLEIFGSDSVRALSTPPDQVVVRIEFVNQYQIDQLELPETLFVAGVPVEVVLADSLDTLDE